jgi:hypothetical protein
VRDEMEEKGKKNRAEGNSERETIPLSNSG